MKYVVAPGACFSNRGKTLEAGAVITADMFDPKSAFDKFVKKGMIIPAKVQTNLTKLLKKLKLTKKRLKKLLRLKLKTK